MHAGPYLPQVRELILLVALSTLTPSPRAEQKSGRTEPKAGVIRIWDVQTGRVINDISIENLPGKIAFYGMPPGMITIFTEKAVCTYDIRTGKQLCKGETPPSRSKQLGAHWTDDDSLQFSESSLSNGERTISIWELQPTSRPSLSMLTSYPVPPHGGEFSLSPVSSHALFVTKAEIVILNLRDLVTQLKVKEVHPLYEPPGSFSSDGSFFACATILGDIHIWKNTSTGYVFWGNIGLLLASKGFTFSPTATSVLNWGPEGFELLHLEISADRTNAGATPQVDTVAARRVVSGPGQTFLYFSSPHPHDLTAKLLMPDTYSRTGGAEHQHVDLRGCLKGTRETVLGTIKLWIKDPEGPPIFSLYGSVGSGKSAVAQMAVRWCISEGKLWSYFSCSSYANDQRDLPHLFTSLAVQLAQQHPEARLAFTRLARAHPDPGNGPPSEQVEQLVVKQLKSADVPAVIVIDGLGEREDVESRSAILCSIEKWTEEIPKVKFLITSRLELSALPRFNPPAPRGAGKGFSLHDIPITFVNKDIRTFLEHELSGLASRRGIEDWPTDNQLDLLCDRAAGVFVYAVATCQVLG